MSIWESWFWVFTASPETDCRAVGLWNQPYPLPLIGTVDPWINNNTKCLRYATAGEDFFFLEISARCSAQNSRYKSWLSRARINHESKKLEANDFPLLCQNLTGVFGVKGVVQQCRREKKLFLKCASCVTLTDYEHESGEKKKVSKWSILRGQRRKRPSIPTPSPHRHLSPPPVALPLLVWLWLLGLKMDDQRENPYKVGPNPVINWVINSC